MDSNHEPRFAAPKAAVLPLDDRGLLEDYFVQCSVSRCATATRTGAGPAYGITMIWALVKLNLLAVGFRMLTWHSYRPGNSLPSETLMRTGSALDFGSSPSFTTSGSVWKAMVLFR